MCLVCLVYFFSLFSYIESSSLTAYCSDDNLSRDDFLRSKMDEEGWVPISLIAGFPKVSF